MQAKGFFYDQGAVWSSGNGANRVIADMPTAYRRNCAAKLLREADERAAAAGIVTDDAEVWMQGTALYQALTRTESVTESDSETEAEAIARRVHERIAELRTRIAFDQAELEALLALTGMKAAA